MARLTTDERLERLQNRYNELVKPVFLIGKSLSSEIEAITILSNGKKETRHFKSLDIFQNYADSLKDCNIIFDKQVRAFKKDTIEIILSEVSKEDLFEIVCDESKPGTAAKLERILYEGMIRQIG